MDVVIGASVQRVDELLLLGARVVAIWCLHNLRE
jgi:hypothetical protein